MKHPNLGLLVKLGSIAVHADEMFSADGRGLDEIALKSVLSDPEVKEWIVEMGALLPLKRQLIPGAALSKEKAK